MAEPLLLPEPSEPLVQVGPSRENKYANPDPILRIGYAAVCAARAIPERKIQREQARGQADPGQTSAIEPWVAPSLRGQAQVDPPSWMIREEAIKAALIYSADLEATMDACWRDMEQYGIHRPGAAAVHEEQPVAMNVGFGNIPEEAGDSTSTSSIRDMAIDAAQAVAEYKEEVGEPAPEPTEAEREPELASSPAELKQLRQALQEGLDRNPVENAEERFRIGLINAMLQGDQADAATDNGREEPASQPVNPLQLATPEDAKIVDPVAPETIEPVAAVDTPEGVTPAAIEQTNGDAASRAAEEAEQEAILAAYAKALLADKVNRAVEKRYEASEGSDRVRVLTTADSTEVLHPVAEVLFDAYSQARDYADAVLADAFRSDPTIADGFTVRSTDGTIQENWESLKIERHSNKAVLIHSEPMIYKGAVYLDNDGAPYKAGLAEAEREMLVRHMELRLLSWGKQHGYVDLLKDMNTFAEKRAGDIISSAIQTQRLRLQGTPAVEAAAVKAAGGQPLWVQHLMVEAKLIQQRVRTAAETERSRDSLSASRPEATNQAARITIDGSWLGRTQNSDVQPTVARARTPAVEQQQSLDSSAENPTTMETQGGCFLEPESAEARHLQKIIERVQSVPFRHLVPPPGGRYWPYGPGTIKPENPIKAASSALLARPAQSFVEAAKGWLGRSPKKLLAALKSAS